MSFNLYANTANASISGHYDKNEIISRKDILPLA